MIKIINNRHGKRQLTGTRLWFLDFYRLFLNLLLLSTIGFLVWYGIKLFKYHVFNAGIGSTIFIASLIFFIWLWRHTKRNGWRKPSMKFTIFCLICLFVITAFAGCEPMVTYKDDVFDKVKTVYNYEKTKWEEEKKQKEIELAQLQKEQEQEKAEEAIKQAQEQEAEKERVKQQEAEQKIKDKQNKIEQEQNKQDRLSEIEHEVVMIVNLIRTDRGSPMLQWDDKLYEYSKQHSIDMGEVGEMFHTDMNKSYAENAWWGGGSSWEAMDIVESWMTSEKHRTWLLCPSLKHVAVGIVYSDTGMYASWTFWRKETTHSDWWYQYTPDNPPQWWY